MQFLLQLINFSMLPSWQLQELNSIVMAAQTNFELSTIVLFGQLDEIEAYIRVMEHKSTPKVIVTLNYGDINLNNAAEFNRKIFFIAVASLERKELWNHMNSAFMGIQGHVRGAFITKRSKKKNARLRVRQHLEWCWSKGFTNALILVDKQLGHQQQFEILNYNHFLANKLINMTNLTKQEMYPDKFRNLNQFKIRTAAFFDPPRVFRGRSKNGEKHETQLVGYAAILLKAFLKEYNADMDLKYFDDNTSYSIMETIQRIENDEIDLSINPYYPYRNAHLSNPLHMLRRCVVVPFPQELAKYKFFIMPFDTKVWLSFLATWLLLSLAKLFGCFIKQSKQFFAQTDGGQIFLEVWRLMMYLPTSTPYSYKNLKWFNAFWFSLIAIMGFIFSNLYMASLTSFFSGLTFKPLIKTLNELIEKRIQVDVIDFDKPAIINNRDLPKDFAELLNARNFADLINEILTLRPNHSYAALEDRIQFTFTQQLHLLQPIQQVVEECLTTMPLGFLVPAHSQFERPLNRFILRSTAAGLIDKWILDATTDGYSSGILHMLLPKLEIARPLTLKHFQFGWMVLAGGHFVGGIVFLLENLKRIFARFKIFIIFY